MNKMDKNQIEPKPDLLPAEEYISQIMSLINNDDEANAALCLELIGVCTPHTFLTGMAVGIFLCSKNQQTREKAHEVLKNTSPSFRTLEFAVRLNMNNRRDYESCHHFASSHANIDYCGCMFICKAFLGYGDYLFWYLFDIKPQQLANINFLKHKGTHTLYLRIENEIDDLLFKEAFAEFKIKRVYFTVKNDYFPIHFMQLPTVKYCHFDKPKVEGLMRKKPSSDATLTSISIKNLQPIADKLTHLFSLDFKNIRIRNSTNLSVLTHLRGIELHNSTFGDTSFLKNMTSLTRLILTNLNLKELPPEIKSLHNLTLLHAIRNKITGVDFDFRQLPKLRDLSIQQDRLDYISDTFQDCTELRSVSLNYQDKAFKVPQSLIDKGFSKK
jgi:hypothetical protein